MDNTAVFVSVLALIVSIYVLYAKGLRFIVKLDVRITHILPSITNEKVDNQDAEHSGVFLVRLVIVNRASVGRTVYEIEPVQPKGYQIDRIQQQYEVTGQNMISLTEPFLTIADHKELAKDDIFHPPLDIAPAQSKIQWIVLKVSQKSQAQRDTGDIYIRLNLLNVNGYTLGKTETSLRI